MGRPVNASNKNKQYLINRLKDMFGDDFDPIINAATNAIEMQKMADEGGDEEFNRRKECGAAWDRIAQYVTPKLKAVEVTGPEGRDLLPQGIIVNVVDPKD